jgi:hypothetical protein
MRKRIRLQISSEKNKTSNLWMQHLVHRIIVNELDLPAPLQAKLLYETKFKSGGNDIK